MNIAVAVGVLFLAFLGGVWNGRRTERERALQCTGLRLRWQILLDGSLPGGAAEALDNTLNSPPAGEP